MNLRSTWKRFFDNRPGVASPGPPDLTPAAALLPSASSTAPAVVLAAALVPAPLAATLPPITGIDPTLSMRYMGGRVDIARRVLHRFAETYRDGLAGLRPALDAADWVEVAALAHAIRGAAGSVGADRLPRLAAQLEAACLADPHPAHIEAAASAMLIELSLITLSAREALGPIEAPPPSLDPLPMDQVLARLEGMLQVFDYEATTLMREQGTRLRDHLGPALAEVETAMQHFDFDQALKALRALRSP